MKTSTMIKLVLINILFFFSTLYAKELKQNTIQQNSSSITSCSELTPKLTCMPTGWILNINAISPNTFSNQDLDLSVKSPSNATITKWGNDWHLNGVSKGDTITLVTNATKIGAGQTEGTDLCCLGEEDITIPNEECTVEAPHIYVRKSYDNNKFRLNSRIMSPIHSPQVLTLTDTLPAGITITGINASSTNEWTCSNVFPISGPATINCVYIGTMPVSGIKDLYLNTQIDYNQMPAQNCVDSGVFSTDGTTLITNQMMHHCITIPKINSSRIKNNITKPDITISKFAPKSCKEGSNCTFTLKITNNGKNIYRGPLSIEDKARGVIPKFLYAIPKKWKCSNISRGYECNNPQVVLNPKESTTIKLTTRIPYTKSNYLSNCAKLNQVQTKRGKTLILQQALNDNGFNPNGIDGFTGEGTKKALSLYMEKIKESNKDTAIKKLLSKYIPITSETSCVKVKIRQNIKKEVLYKEVLQKCPDWQHWDGKRCISCPMNTKWNKTYQECLEDKKIVKKTEIVKEIECGFLEKYNKETKQCESVININLGVGIGGGNNNKSKD